MNTIRYVGYDAVHPDTFSFDRPFGQDCYLLLLTHTPASFMIHDSLQEYPANSAILYPPDTRIFYQAVSNTYSDDWLRFESNESYVTEFPLLGIPFCVTDPAYCHHLLQLITWEHSFQHSNSPMIIDQLIHVLFLKLYEDSNPHEVSQQERRLLTLRKSICNYPQYAWSIEYMSEQTHLSTGHLQYLYKKNFGITCIEEVIQNRIHMAQDYLIYSSRNVTEIAEACGYNNPEHFCRQFRQHCGMTPLQFRKSTQPAPKHQPQQLEHHKNSGQREDGNNTTTKKLK